MLSMTGYGKGVSTSDQLELSVELKSVNNRYLDILLKMPKHLLVFENKIREWIKKDVLRGKVSVFIDLNERVTETDDVLLDERKIKSRYHALKKVRDVLGMEGPVRLDHLVAFPEIFEADYSDIPEESVLQMIEVAMKQALDDFNAMRRQEGAFLENDMCSRIDIIEDLIEKAFETGKTTVAAEFRRLTDQVTSLIGEQKIDRDRLEQEIALIADKVDITEECIRMRSHIKLFRDAVKAGNDVGKKLNFILQEMLRESNTINSKSTEIETVHNMIRIKEEIEKLREQSQNIE